VTDNELVALIERRFDRLEERLLTPEEQVDRIDRGVGPTEERLRRIAARISDLERRLDDVRPMPITRVVLSNLEYRIASIERAHTALEVDVTAMKAVRE
jgi:uncharacterized coiled-coil protein SlyX